MKLLVRVLLLFFFFGISFKSVLAACSGTYTYSYTDRYCVSYTSVTAGACKKCSSRTVSKTAPCQSGLVAGKCVASELWTSCNAYDYFSGCYRSCVSDIGERYHTCCTITDGGWSDWSSCDNCQMTRTCTNPAPSCGGATCVGPSTQSCGFTNGICGSSLNTCSWGTVSGITTESFIGGINNVWYCNGLCGGTTAKCTSLLCNSIDGINTMCTGDRLCVNGITASNVTDDGIDYIWDCIGTAGTCDGTDGSSQTGCRYAIAQESWFQTINSGVFGKSTISNYVPPTCKLSTDCTEATSIRGLVAAPIINGFDNIDYSSPKNWYTNQNLTTKINFFEKYKKISGVGTTLIEGDLSDSNIINNTDGLLMVDGNVTISQDKENVDDEYFFMIVASGDITVDPSVTKFDGMLVGNNINIGGTSINQLTINGSLYGTNLVNITRSFTDKMDNNDSPAVVVSYRPDFIFNMPSSMAKNVTEWRWGN